MPTTLATRQFLVHCLRAFLAAEGTPSETPPAEAVDWGSLVHLAAFHRVAPLLDRSLREGCPPAVPAAVRADLAAYVRSLSSRSLLLTGELVRLLKQLEAQGVLAIPFKGPALACLLYGDPALRHFDDLDILVRRQDFSAAKSVILSLGYQPKEQYVYHESFMLARGSTELVVELHWDIMPEDFPLRLDLEGIWERRASLPLGGAQAATLSPEDLLLFLCLHGSRHQWLRLQWLCDVAQLIRRYPSLDWEKVMEQARIAGGRRMLFLGIYLANDILGAPLPPEIEQKVRRDPPIAKLAGQVKWRLFEGPLQLFKPWKRADFRSQLMDRAWDRLSCLSRRWLDILTTPRSTDWNSLPLPDALFPLYYVIRPLRLAGKYALRAVSQFFHRHKRT
jgi:hypothetical protein